MHSEPPPRRQRLPHNPKPNKPRSRIRWWRVVLFLGMWGALFAGAVGGVYSFWASRYDMNDVQQIRERSTVFDRDGKAYGRLQGENRLVVSLRQVSPYFVKALIAREDSRFYEHSGVDPVGILRAVVRNLVSRSAAQGASTLTQQLARNSFPLGGKNIHRKILEAFVSFRIEKHYSKPEILEHYMNRIYFGAGVFGIETASQAYFNKKASQLTLGEAAMMSGIIRGPTRFSPVTNFEGALRERDTVLDRMVKVGSITPAEAAAAKEQPITMNPKRRLTVQENYAMDMVVRELSKLVSDDQLAEGGLRIYTALDPVLQQTAQDALNNHLTKIEGKTGYNHPKKADFTKEARDAELDPAYIQGAVVVLDNRTGGIRAVVGGRDYGDSRFNRALLSQRPIGSTFKSFVYLTAFSRGLAPGSMISDSPLQKGEVKGGAAWSPQNSDGTFKGPMPAEEGLIQSRNTVTVRVGETVGLQEVSRVAKAVGIEKMPLRPASYLGAFEATLLQLTTAYTVFPNSGQLRKPHLIERVDDAVGNVLYRANPKSSSALPSGACNLVASTLAKVLDRGTGAAARANGFKKIAAGKTGTTDEYKDAWFVGFTTSLTAGVWVGFDKPQSTVAQGYGATMALPVWIEVINAAPEQRYPAGQFRGGGEMASAVTSDAPPRAVPTSRSAEPVKAEPVRAEPVLKPFVP